MPLSLRKIKPGSQNGIACVFLHGFMGSTNDWARLDFPETVAVYAIDLPGHGASSRSISTLNNFERVTEEIHSCVISAGLTGINLIGYSMGGRIAMSVASTHPDLVHTLILESSSPGLARTEDREARLASDRARSRDLLADPAHFIRSWFELPVFSSLSDHTDLRKQLIYERSSGPVNEWAEAMVAFSQGVQPDFRPWLLENGAGICMITGALDQVYTEAAESLNRKNRRIRHICVPGAGHNVHLEQPDMYLAVLSDVLDWRYPTRVR